jgi:hypothetical protein
LLDCGDIRSQAFIRQGIRLREKLNQGAVAIPSEKLIVKLSCFLRAGADDQYGKAKVMIKASHKIRFGGAEHYHLVVALPAEDGCHQLAIDGGVMDQREEPAKVHI